MSGFAGVVSVTWQTQPGDDRNMKLNQDFSFVDAAGLKWTAKKGANIDGASIPSIFWTSFGSPFIGDYRQASVIHDYYCDVRTRSSDATHKMFYEACVAGGVGETRAKTMYFMVKTFGPSWKILTEALALEGHVVLKAGAKMSLTHTMSTTEASRLTQWIERDNPSIAEIDAAIEISAQPAAILPLKGTLLQIEPVAAAKERATAPKPKARKPSSGKTKPKAK